MSNKLIYNLFSREDGLKSDAMSNIKVYLWIPLSPNSGRDYHLTGIWISYSGLVLYPVRFDETSYRFLTVAFDVLPEVFVEVIVYAVDAANSVGVPERNPVVVLKVKPAGAVGEIA